MGTDRHAQGGPRDDCRKAFALVALQLKPLQYRTFLGGGLDEGSSSYNYAAAYQYLSQYYEMSCLNEEDAIDEKTLSACDVLVIKIPRFRFTPEEVEAVVHFVEAGGGLLLIGDHTNLESSAAHMNDISPCLRLHLPRRRAL